MGRNFRYWFRNIEEGIVVTIGILAVVLFMQPIIWGNGIKIGCVGFILAIIQSIYMLVVSIQSFQLVSINVIFGGIRKDSLKAMYIAMLAGLAQIELMQVILAFVPVIDKNLQFLAICYTPILFFFGTGIAFMVSSLQIYSEKVYKVIFAIFCTIVGMMISLIGAVSGDLLDSIGGRQVRNVLDGAVMGICFVISVVVYMTGIWIHNRTIRNMDVRI